MISLAQLIQTHRKKAGLAQAKLAKLAGVGKTVVWDLEHGKESVQWDTLQKIFRVLSITVEWRSPMLERAAATQLTPAPGLTLSPTAPKEQRSP
ncbi:MAG: helix-turn-helix domain-containing protein [Opitutaceae bacterium]|nr:helix-turn-helix domain-containing protein [Opitutaceae bacterium]